MVGLQLERGQWYAWQMIPGYGDGVPYFSPIRVDSVTPKKAGNRTLQLSFLNALYAPGVQSFVMDLRILKHSEDFLIAEIEDETEGGRSAVISRISYVWLDRLCPNLRLPPQGEWPATNVSDFLDRFARAD